ncbi:MAG: DUF87 domain-containing protein [Gemmatimonadaceae bacterium]
MSAPLLSFREKGAGVHVDLDRLIESRMLVQTNSGGGKSHAIRYLCEQTRDKVQQIVIDREGEFATLREKYDYLLVGRDGDVAADIRSSRLLARKLMELELSAVIDLSEMSLAHQRDYVREFLNALNHLPRPLWKDCLVIIDEAHLFAPESGKGSSVATEAISMLLSTGRKRGYCGVLATQRLAKLNKDVAAECLNKLIGRTSNEDARRAADELDQGKQGGRELRSLEPGTFWAYGPAIATEPVLVRTGDVNTQPPKRGTSRGAAPVAPEAIKKVLAELAELPKQAADEERSMQDLQRDVATLRRKLTIAEKSGTERVVEKKLVDQEAIDAAYRRGQVAAQSAFIKEHREAAKTMRGLIGQLERVTGSLGDTIAPGLKFLLTSFEEVQPATAEPPRFQRREAPVREMPARREFTRVATSGAPSTLARGERIMLTAVAQYPDGAARDQLSVLTGYKRSSRDTYLQRLSTAGYIEAVGDLISATDEGIEALGSDFQPLPEGEELREFWLARLPEGERRILEVLVSASGDAIQREELDDITGYKRSSRDTYLQRLKSRRLIEDVGRGLVRASATLFSETTR